MQYLILGAGPAGLTVANRLKQKGITDFLVLEREETAGGLCRSVEVDGGPFDMGGGHFLDVRHPEVNEFLFDFMPEEEWDKYDRDSKIEIGDNIINYPIEANIWQMNINDQVEYLKAIATAGCNTGKAMPNLFVDWIYWKLGNKIADEYMIPYNQKMFGKELNRLGTYWLDKLPNVSFEDTLRSCIEKKAYGNQPGHVQFYYPKKYGYGELWSRMANEIKDNIEFNKIIKKIDYNTKTIYTSLGEAYSADVIITTIPWLEFDEFVGMPSDIQEDIKELKYSSVQIEYFAEHIDTSSQWIYYPDPKVSYHRILVRHNFCSKGKGFWTETNSERIDKNADTDRFRYMNKYAYPLNTIRKPEIMSRLLDWNERHGVIGIGRWGEHQHYNSDVTVGKAISLVERLLNR